MSDLLTPDSLELRLDRAASDLRTDDPEAIGRVVARTRPAPRAVSRPTTVRLRYAAGALTMILAGTAIWPHGEGSQAQAAMTFERVQAATRAAPHSIARSYGADGKLSGYTVWREGTKYASELWTRGHKRIQTETRSDGGRKILSFQFEEDPVVPGYRYAMLSAPAPAYEIKFDTLEAILQTYRVRGGKPEQVSPPERKGDRVIYRIRPGWTNERPVVVEADAESGRVQVVHNPAGGCMVIDYETSIPARVFEPRVSDPTVVVLDLPRLKHELASDLRAGAGAWLTGEGMLWRVYRGSAQRPLAIAGLRLRGTKTSKNLERDGVVAVGSTLAGAAPRTIRIAGKTVPVRRIGRIDWWVELFASSKR